ncbi:rod shape-determining protein MreC [Granulicella arctica]|uniref:Cell shape-determining protein MreC n=1 Tax=Granulicella arctica TaxID=940613 RepID=A0A7Y9PK93_9BACT|nr:rod shape-determining protein MreC [Granulicella arctica]NYF81391.1 rod shape-determining protein MreC [Granulicella arctica]
MESFFTRFKNALVLIAVLLAQTIGLAIQVRRPAASDQPDGPRVYLLRYWVSSAVTPFERLFHGIGTGVGGTWSNYLDLRHTRQQNQLLRQQIAELRLEQAAFAEDAIQGHRLQTLLDFQQHYIAKTVAAQVIGTSGSDLSRMVTLDKGSDDGLKPDMAVITPDGVVGKLRDVFPRTSQLLLLNDQTSGAGVILQSTRIRAVVRGTPTGRLQIGNLTADSRIKPGDTVLTSGGDLVYPRGLNVGTIESIAPDPDHQPYTAIVVKPTANLSQLEEVLIVTATQTSLSPQAKQDLAQGAATADTLSGQILDNKRAADLLSERLPSLHDIDPSYVDPTGTTSATNPDDANPAKPENVGGTVPSPLPTLHPDHFTPGTTPPAVDLTPGAQAPPVSTFNPTDSGETPRKTAKPAAPKSTPPDTEPQQ